MSERLQVGDVLLEVAEWDGVYMNLIPEIIGPYQFDSIPFEEGDVVLDIGAHVGLVSMYLAKLHPEISIFSYEPVPSIYDQLEENIKLNDIRNVIPYQLAVTADGRDLEMKNGRHSAEASAWFTERDDYTYEVKSTTMQKIIEVHALNGVKLLKLDCECAEHEILADNDEWIDLVEYVRGEIHMIPPLAEAGYTVEGTIERVPAEKAVWQIVEGVTVP